MAPAMMRSARQYVFKQHRARRDAYASSRKTF